MLADEPLVKANPKHKLSSEEAVIRERARNSLGQEYAFGPFPDYLCILISI